MAWGLSYVAGRLKGEGATIISTTTHNFVASLALTLEQERDRWLLWIPVFFGSGIGLYFALLFEPSTFLGVGVLLVAAITGFTFRAQPLILTLGLILCVGAAGFTSAQWRAHRLSAPVIQKKTRPVTLVGQVEKVTLRADGGLRLVLVNPNISGFLKDETPVKVRITVRSAGDEVKPGDRARLRAILLPPPEPVAPGAYDFSRQAWFDRVGAVGYGITGIQRLPTDFESLPLIDQATIFIGRAQTAISSRIRGAMSGAKGPVAAALMTGDRGGIPEQITQNLRDAGLAHLLAISGLHMGLMAALLFFAVRGGFALWESVALRYPIKKWAAAAAMLGVLGYLLLTGASVSTQRAFIMTSIVLLAILVDRSAISMRLVAWATMIVIMIAPESLWHAGFQMSFAAVIGLIATYEALRDKFPYSNRKSFRYRAGLYLAGPCLRHWSRAQRRHPTPLFISIVSWITVSRPILLPSRSWPCGSCPGRLQHTD